LVISEKVDEINFSEITSNETLSTILPLNCNIYGIVENIYEKDVGI
jgi:hypothetical protein